MGNCGSSIDCTACIRDRWGTKGWEPKCPSQRKVNADIAGIGILVSFYFSALAVFVVVIRGYLTSTLPSGLLQSTDQHAITILKGPFRRKGRHDSAEIAIFIQTPKQQSRSHVLVKFIKMLSDQQLITGISILIAALSGRCAISQNEWHIVTSLAYFSATTHSLSLDVLRNHLAHHRWVRYCRVAFTLVFLILFTFTFLVDNLREGYSSKIVQCTLEEWTSDPGLMSVIRLVTQIIPILTILWGKHISAIARLAAPEVAYQRHVTATLMDRIFMYLWSRSKPPSEMELASIIADARLDYDTRMKPPCDTAKISVWYFLEQYHEAYLSEIPVWAFQFVFGTANTISAVLVADVYPSSDAGMLGFGQVVAIGLLVLPLLALVEIINEQTALDSSLSLSTQGSLHQIDIANTSSPNLTASEPLIEPSVRVQGDGVSGSGHIANSLPSKADRKVATRSLVLCASSTALMIFVGGADFVQLYMLLGIVPAWALSKLTIALRRQIHQARFVWKEMKSRKTKKTSLQASPMAHSTSGDSTSHNPPRLPSLDMSDNQRENAHITATETSPTFERPRRQDTEASLGLNALFNRQDGSS
ncbi:hypothetical protein BKA58DRAFT_62471 [Alternaria rosae]|uniref:uncharacterized protein n=1 Tax=Alternaria rosae TaxID=1187941 RepID=UPI001E8ED431|nr:uncharacterized protein BKA58DRAFT_62471 [Alternaria rosae]KAH6852899.1 hypothetical protein BKA58DRAFT_62471 [Alternaria rosae]